MDADSQVLYVGKAKNLKKRVKSYSNYQGLSKKIKQLVEKAQTVKWQILESEVQALLIEAELIKAHQPFYNNLLKDDKSQIYVLITKEKFPRVLKLRKTDLTKKIYQPALAILGPFANSYQLSELLKIVRPIFPWCNKVHKNNQACFYYHLELCPGACCGQISSSAYQDNIKRLIMFLRGKNQALVKQLTQQMRHSAEEQNFEEAQVLKQQVELIKKITQQRYRMPPNLILPDFTRQLQEEALVHLRHIMHQEHIVPANYQFKRIEAYDVSNTQGKQATVSMVVFSNGQADHGQYKFFKIRQLDTPNDYAMLQEALTRRQKHPEWGRPDLLLIDGGKGQLRAAMKVWNQAPITLRCPIISLVKHPDRLVLIKAKPDNKGWTTQVIALASDHPTLQLLAQVRDEAHRFAKKQHTRLRRQNLLQ